MIYICELRWYAVVLVWKYGMLLIDGSEENMIINGKFTSVWADEGEIETSCKVNTDTHEVFDIEIVDPADYGMECEILEYEYVEFGDGKKLYRFPVYLKENKESNGAYWRED